MVLVDYLETQEPLIVFIRVRILDDTDMMDLLDNVYHGWAKKDADFPYIGFRIDNDYDGADEGYIASGTLYTDIWDYNQLPRRAFHIRGHLIRLFDKLKVGISGISCARFSLQGFNDVPEDTENIIHHAGQWNIRYDRKLELEQIMGVSNNE